MGWIYVINMDNNACKYLDLLGGPPVVKIPRKNQDTKTRIRPSDPDMPACIARVGRARKKILYL